MFCLLLCLLFVWALSAAPSAVSSAVCLLLSLVRLPSVCLLVWCMVHIFEKSSWA
jgi:hypothetical protein